MQQKQSKYLWGSILLALGALLYLLAPMDVVPDPFLGLGQLDDALVAVLGFRAARKAWRHYRAFGAQQPVRGKNEVPGEGRVLDDEPGEESKTP